MVTRKKTKASKGKAKAKAKSKATSKKPKKVSFGLAGTPITAGGE